MFFVFLLFCKLREDRKYICPAQHVLPELQAEAMHLGGIQGLCVESITRNKHMQPSRLG